MAFSIVWTGNQQCSVPDLLAILYLSLIKPIHGQNVSLWNSTKSPLLSNFRPTGNFQKSNPYPLSSAQLELTETLHNSNEYEVVLPYQGTSHSEVIIYSHTWLYQRIKKNRNGFRVAEVRHIQTFIKANQIKEKQKCVWYSGGFVISRVLSSEFDCG